MENVRQRWKMLNNIGKHWNYVTQHWNYGQYPLVGFSHIFQFCRCFLQSMASKELGIRSERLAKVRVLLALYRVLPLHVLLHYHESHYMETTVLQHTGCFYHRFFEEAAGT